MLFRSQPNQLGTESIQVVHYARQLFEKGDLYKGIRPRSFDQVYPCLTAMNTIAILTR